MSDLTVSGRGRGLIVETDGATIQSVVLENGGFPALGFIRTGGETVVADVLVRGDLADAPGQVTVLSLDSRVVARRLSVIESEAGLAAIGIAGRNGALEAEDLLVADTAAASNESGGGGIVIQDHGSLRLERAVVRGNHTWGIFASQGSTVHLTDIEVSGTQRSPVEASYETGVRAEAGTAVTLERAFIARNYSSGIVARGAGSTLEAVDVVVEETLPAGLNDGNGISIEAGAVGHAARAFIRASHSRGLVAFTDVLAGEAAAALQLEDAIVLDSGTADASPGDGRYGAFVQSAPERVAQGRSARLNEPARAPGLYGLLLPPQGRDVAGESTR